MAKCIAVYPRLSCMPRLSIGIHAKIYTMASSDILKIAQWSGVLPRLSFEFRSSFKSLWKKYNELGWSPWAEKWRQLRP